MRLGALKIAILYVVAGILWITLSDNLLLAMQKHFDLRVVLFISSIKGVGYVLLTGLLLYKLIGLHTQRLAASELRYRSYFDDNPSPMWIIDFRTMAFIAVNEAAIAYYGYKREEFMQMSVFDICPPDDRNTIYTALRELKPGMNDSGNWRHLKKDGTVIDVHITAHLLKQGKSGNVMAMVKGINEHGGHKA
jgi:PAS domain S-box-containing protein